MIKLEQWSVTYSFEDPYRAPETIPRSLKGIAFGHPRGYDGRWVRTSPITSSCEESRTVITQSGSVYVLGKPDPNWIKWLVENEKDWKNIFPKFK